MIAETYMQNTKIDTQNRTIEALRALSEKTRQETNIQPGRSDNFRRSLGRDHRAIRVTRTQGGRTSSGANRQERIVTPSKGWQYWLLTIFVAHRNGALRQKCHSSKRRLGRLHGDNGTSICCSEDLCPSTDMSSEHRTEHILRYSQDVCTATLDLKVELGSDG